MGMNHPELGAKIAGSLFGDAYYDLVLLHSWRLARKLGATPSKLCWADKASILFEPEWFYLLRARASGELAEYRDKAAWRVENRRIRRQLVQMAQKRFSESRAR